jgi:hypothetical protein
MASKNMPTGMSTQLLTPGPGNYNPSIMLSKSGVGVTMGSKYDFSFKSNNQPGPGTYNLKGSKKGGIKIGNAKRTDLNDK